MHKSGREGAERNEINLFMGGGGEISSASIPLLTHIIYIIT